MEDLRATIHIVEMSGQTARHGSAPQTSPSITVRTTSDSAIHESPRDDRSVVVPNNAGLWKQPTVKNNAVESGLVSWEQAVFWYRR